MLFEKTDQISCARAGQIDFLLMTFRTMTKKQKLASERNWLKFRLTGLLGVFKEKPSFTEEENRALNEINETVKSLLKNFDKNSAEKGLEVNFHKCFCGKPAKYLAKVGPVPGVPPFQVLCKKHLKEIHESEGPFNYIKINSKEPEIADKLVTEVLTNYF